MESVKIDWTAKEEEFKCFITENGRTVYTDSGTFEWFKENWPCQLENVNIKLPIETKTAEEFVNNGGYEIVVLLTDGTGAINEGLRKNLIKLLTKFQNSPVLLTEYIGVNTEIKEGEAIAIIESEVLKPNKSSYQQAVNIYNALKSVK